MLFHFPRTLEVKDYWKLVSFIYASQAQFGLKCLIAFSFPVFFYIFLSNYDHYRYLNNLAFIHMCIHSYLYSFIHLTFIGKPTVNNTVSAIKEVRI